MDSRGASSISRVKIWRATKASLKLLALPAFFHVLCAKTYKVAKQANLLEQRQQVKSDTELEALKGWMRNIDDDFEIEPE